VGFFPNPDANDPKYIIGRALEGGFNGIAIQIGLAEKFYWDYADAVPLVLKLNGKTDIPSAIDPLSPVNATVEDALRLGADPVGYTLYVGTPAQSGDFAQYLHVREDARRLGMPLIVWSYPRGTAVDAKGGKDSFYAVDYVTSGSDPARSRCSSSPRSRRSWRSTPRPEVPSVRRRRSEGPGHAGLTASGPTVRGSV
jgi:DhnA family fructose-bisphosphate aldolase class Ia